MRNTNTLTRILVPALLLTAASVASAATYQVGPGKTYAEVTDLPALQAGDVVEIQGDHTYQPIWLEDAGTAASPIVLRGIKVNGKRPVFAGSDYTVVLKGNHTVLESIEVTGGTDVCVLHKADDITLRDVVVHDCTGHGILGTDEESGSLTISYSEIYRTGFDERRHQVYVATDELMYPGSVFRLEHSYIHDGSGGNNVKSRAERTEIYYNWIEGAVYHELDLIGSDGADTDVAREDSDVVGNVLVKSSDWFIARIGGDGTGETKGRYRFAFNTMVLAGGDLVIKAQDGIESLELWDNVVIQGTSDGVRLLSEGDALWTTGSRVVAGTHNWLPMGTDDLGMTGNLHGSDARLMNMTTSDFRPADGSPLIDAASSDTPSPAGHAFVRPEALPLYLPPARTLEAMGSATQRPLAGVGLDLGALEVGAGPPVSDPGDPADPMNPGDPADPVNPGDPADPADPMNPAIPGDPTSDPGAEVAGGCSIGGGHGTSGLLGFGLVIGAMFLARRRRRS